MEFRHVWVTRRMVRKGLACARSFHLCALEFWVLVLVGAAVGYWHRGSHNGSCWVFRRIFEVMISSDMVDSKLQPVSKAMYMFKSSNSKMQSIEEKWVDM